MLGFKKKTPAKPVKKPNLKSEDLGEFAERQNTFARDNRHLQTQLKMGLIALISSVMLNFAQSGMILAILPLKTVVPFVMQTYADSDVIVHLEPAPLTDTNAKFLVEQIVRQYIANRNTIVPFFQEMERRWFAEDSYIASHSSPRIFVNFQEEAQTTWDLLSATPIYRTVTINKVRTFSFPIWEADFVTQDRNLGSNEIIRQTSWRVNLTLALRDYQNTTVTKQDILRNPLGVEVIDYIQKEVVPKLN